MSNPICTLGPPNFDIELGADSLVWFACVSGSDQLQEHQNPLVVSERSDN